MAAIFNNITSALLLFEVLADSDIIIFDVSNDFEGIANNVFSANFNTCIVLKLYDLDERWKTYNYLTFVEGRIGMLPRTKVNIGDLLHLLWESMRMSEDPEATPFPTGDMDDIIERYNTHRQ